MNRRLFWMHLKVHEAVQGVVYVHHDPPINLMYKDRHMKKFKRVMRHIKLNNMNRRLFCLHLEVHEVVQAAVHVHHNHHVPHEQVQAQGVVLEG
jgi:hypothetical protein